VVNTNAAMQRHLSHVFDFYNCYARANATVRLVGGAFITALAVSLFYAVPRIGFGRAHFVTYRRAHLPHYPSALCSAFLLRAMLHGIRCCCRAARHA